MPSKKRSREKPDTAQGVSSVSVDLSKYEAPVIGFADAIAIQSRKDVVEVTFFEGRQRPKAIFIARFFITHTDLTAVSKHSADFFEAMKAMPDRNTWDTYRIDSTVPADIVGADAPAPQCSIIGAAKSGESALFECFYVSASSIHRLTVGKGQLKIVPLFAIQLPAGLAWSFVERVHELVSSWSTGKV